MQKIETVCVIGAGVMGSGIAAQVANSKTNVILLDIADNESGNKNKIVNDAYERLFTQKPAPLSHPNYAKYIKIGNLEDDISLIREADLIIEVIVESAINPLLVIFQLLARDIMVFVAVPNELENIKLSQLTIESTILTRSINDVNIPSLPLMRGNNHIKGIIKSNNILFCLIYFMLLTIIYSP